MTQYQKFGNRTPPWPKLRRFRPITRLPGKQRAWIALATVVGGYFAPLLVQAAGGSDLLGVVVGGGLCVAGIVIGWRARDSHGRGIASTAVVMGAAFAFAYLVLFRGTWQ